MRVVIIEDEPPAINILKKLLAGVEPNVEVVASLDSVSSAVNWFTTHRHPDLVFMDIQLSDGLSFEIFDAVSISVPIIFVTAYDEYAIKAFKVNGIDYLLKPIDLKDLQSALNKFHRLADAGKKKKEPTRELHGLIETLRRETRAYKLRFLVPYQDRFISIPTTDILYFVSAHKQTFVVSKENKKFPLDTALDAVEQELDPANFFRVNRQFLVAFEAITSIHNYFNNKLKISLRGCTEEVIISKEKAGSFKKWLGR